MSDIETQRQVIDTLRIDVGIIKNQMSSLQDSNKKIIDKMDSFQFAKQSDVAIIETKLAKIENRTTVLEQKMKPIEKVYWLVLGGFVAGIIALLFWLIQRGVSS